MEKDPTDLERIAVWSGLNKETFRKQYKFHLSSFSTWAQKAHCTEWLLFPKNLGTHLSIDETSLSNGELYTILTNKDAHGKKGALVAMVKGTKAQVVSGIINRIPTRDRMGVREVTLDLDNSMHWIVLACFPNAEKVNDRFHVQCLVSDALQDMRIEERWKAIAEESEEIARSRAQGKPYRAPTYANGDTKKQLLARSRHVLFKPQGKWTESQRERAQLLFSVYPKLKEAYELSMQFRSFYEHSKTKEEAKTRLQSWYVRVCATNFTSFHTAVHSLKAHEGTILNYFSRRATNAAAESFNAKIKGFRALLRGVTDLKFFLFRISMIYG